MAAKIVIAIIKRRKVKAAGSSANVMARPTVNEVETKAAKAIIARCALVFELFKVRFVMLRWDCWGVSSNLHIPD